MAVSEYQRGYRAALMAMSGVQSQEHAVLQRVRALAETWNNGGPVPKAMAKHLYIALAVHKGDPITSG